MASGERPTIFITGGLGMLGRAMGDAAGARALHGMCLGSADCDITSAESVERLFRQHRPTVLVNCAAYTKVDLCEKEPQRANAVNGSALGILADTAAQYETKLVHISTDFVFNGRQQRPYLANDPTDPLSAYGRSKLLGEQLLQSRNPAGWLIVRTAWLYGWGGACFPRTMVERAREGKPLKVVNDQTGTPTYTADLAEAILDLIEHKAGGIWHLTNSGQTTWFDFAKCALEEFGLPPDVSAITSADWRGMYPESALRPAYSVLAIDPYQKLTGKTMRPWRQALSAYHQVVEARGA